MSTGDLAKELGVSDELFSKWLGIMNLVWNFQKTTRGMKFENVENVVKITRHDNVEFSVECHFINRSYLELYVYYDKKELVKISYLEDNSYITQSVLSLLHTYKP